MNHVSKVTPEGRVLIPAAIRHRLGLNPGDAVEFVLDGDTITLATPRMRLEAVRARHGKRPQPGDAAAAVRAARDEDFDASEARADRAPVGAKSESPGSVTEVDSAVEASLARALGLEQ